MSPKGRKKEGEYEKRLPSRAANTLWRGGLPWWYQCILGLWTGHEQKCNSFLTKKFKIYCRFVHNSFKFAGYTATIKDKPTAFQKLLCCVIHLSFFSLPANGTALPCMGGAVLFYVLWEEYQCMRIFGKIYRFAVLLLRFLYKIRFKIFPGSGQVRNYMILYSWYLAVSLQLSFCAEVTEPQHNIETDRIYWEDGAVGKVRWLCTSPLVQVLCAQCAPAYRLKGWPHSTPCGQFLKLKEEIPRYLRCGSVETCRKAARWIVSAARLLIAEAQQLR